MPLGVKPRDAERSKNFFALGLVSWMYTRPTEPTLDWIERRFGANELVAAANRAAFLAGYNFGETTEAVGHRFEVRPAHLPDGRVHERHRQHGAGVGHRRRRPARQAPRDARLLPDHAGVRHPPRAVQAQALRRAHRAGRGRDRRRRDGPRRGVRRAPRRHDDERPGHGAEERDDQPGRVAGAAAARSSTSSAAARPPGCPPRPRPPTSTWPCSAAPARHRCR